MADELGQPPTSSRRPMEICWQFDYEISREKT